MPHNLELIVTLAAALGAALALGLLTHKLHLSPIVGYLFAGVLLGPFTPGFVANVGSARPRSNSTAPATERDKSSTRAEARTTTASMAAPAVAAGRSRDFAVSCTQQ